jgi:Cu(I)/Ag(I) efflux system membrane protein CusA/SilA
VGGRIPEAVVEANPNQLASKGLAFTDLLAGVQARLASSPRPSFQDLKQITLPSGAPSSQPGAVGLASTGQTVSILDLASVRIDDDMSSAVADLGGVQPAVGGIVIAARGADIAKVVRSARQVLEQETAKLSPSVRVVTVYDRLELSERTQSTLLRALVEEIAVVVLVILIFLLHWRSALLPLVTLPVVLFLTFAAMRVFGVPATIMSLGGIGIALGMAVDADVVALEACHRRLERSGASGSRDERRASVVAAAASFAPAILTSLLITAIAFLPVLAFEGETGRLLRPLALTKTFVILAASLVAVTLAPALRDRLLAGRVRAERDHPLTRNLVRAYKPFVHFALARPLLTLGTAMLALLSCVPILSRLGGEFLPRVDEGDLLFMPTTLPGVSKEQVASQLWRQDRAIADFKEVSTVFGKVGRADSATDPAPMSMAETTIRLRPRSEWPEQPRSRWYSGWAPSFLRPVLGILWPETSPSSSAELVQRLDDATRLPGWTNAWTAPVRGRMDMMSTGVRTPVGIRIVAAGADRLQALGVAVRSMALRIEGTRSAVFESLGGEPRWEFATDAAAAARQGVDARLAQSTADVVSNGGQIGDVEHDGRLARVVVTPDSALRGPADQLRGATVRADASGLPVPLALVGRPFVSTRPSVLRTERGELVAYVYVDLTDGTDPSTYVRRAARAFDSESARAELGTRSGERIEWAGQYALLSAGEKRLAWIVPVVAISMIALLYAQFRSWIEALIVLVSVPFALVGSFWTLFLLGYRLSAPVWVGLLSVAGLAMQTGVVMVLYIDEAFYERVRAGRLRSREDIVAAHGEGTIQRLRPKLMTITTMAAGLLPLLWAEGAGSEIMRRIAAPMVGGLLTSAFLTLEVLPVLYTLWRTRQLRRAESLGVSIEEIVTRKRRPQKDEQVQA